MVIMYLCKRVLVISFYFEYSFTPPLTIFDLVDIMYEGSISHVHVNFVSIVAFTECGKANGLLLPLLCRKQNSAMNKCIIEW